MRPPPNPAIFTPLVWTIVRQVPFGTVSTYGQIASMIPPCDDIPETDFRRLAPKWVGDALNAVSYSDVDGKPVAVDVPWWRIINSKGGISLPRGSNVAHQQRTRLVAENITFDARGTVDLNTFGWEGPTSDWLAENQLLAPISLRKPGSPQQMTLF